jgi:vacuolar-type H+-ATPase subunit H
MESNTSLLEAIHYKEADVIRRLAAAHQAVQSAVKLAQQQAHEQVLTAENLGRQEGEAQGQQLMAQAEREATAIVAQAQAEAITWRTTVETHLETAVTRAVALVLRKTS